jgi:Tfp pilus assembly protein PilX
MATQNRTPAFHPERGIALVTALLVLMLVSVVGLTMMTSTVGERQIASNVHTARGALVSADAGIRTMEQFLANRGRDSLNARIAMYAGVGPILQNPGTIFPNGAITSSSTNPPYATSATVQLLNTSINPDSQLYFYRYTINSTGQFGLAGRRQVQSTGVLRVSANRATFAQYLMWTQAFTTGSGGSIWFTSDSRFDGKVHTNGKFRFAYQPYFEDEVTSVDGRAFFYNQGNPLDLAANFNGSIDVPQFFGGFTRNHPSIPMPTNSYNQQSAALGLTPTGSAPSNSTINSTLGTGAGSGAVPNGIYVVTNPAPSGGTPAANGSTMTGGLYIQGTANEVRCTADTTNNRQIIRVTQGGTIKTITIDRAANTTTLVVGATTRTYTGVPAGITYCNGAISDLRGPDRASGTTPPALVDGHQMLVAATQDITIQRDITVENFDSGQGVLGIFSSGGDVRIGTSAPNNMYLDAYIMATGGGSSGQGEFAVDSYNSGSPRGTFHLRGGVVQQYYGPFFTFNSSGTLQTGFARDFRYDGRGLVPPYYPSIPLFVQTNLPTARTLAWKEM